MYKTQIQSLDNSQMILLPKSILDEVGFKQSEKVEIQVVNGSIVITKAKPKTFKELMEGFEGTYESKEWDTGKPVGKEVF